MPSTMSHFVCAKLISEELGLNHEDFTVGNILPDLVENQKRSHLKFKKGQIYLPDVELAVKNIIQFDDTSLGYLAHLMLDRKYLDAYVPKFQQHGDNVPELFSGDKIYHDYSILNTPLLEYFEIDKDKINEIMKRINTGEYPKDEASFIKNVKQINKPKVDGKLKFINFDEYVGFLKKTSNEIANDLRML